MIPVVHYRLLAFIAMGIALAATSYVVYYKKLEFLAAGATHAALFAVVIALVLEYHTGVSYNVFAIPIGLAVVYVAGVLVKRGIPPEKASALVVSTTSAMAVLSAYYALTALPGKVSLSALLLGDPLLLTRDEALLGILVSLFIVILVCLVQRVVVETSIDEVSARVAGVNVTLYDVLVYTLIGVATIGMLRFAGYVMEHVFLLLPAIATAGFSRNTREHLVLTIISGLLSATLGYALSYAFKSIPTGITGLLLVGLFILSYSRLRR